MSEPRTSDPNVDRVLWSWLHEDRHEDVSRVAGAVLDRLDTTPQRRSQWLPARRFLLMNKIVPLGLGAAAVVVALVIGYQFLGPAAPGGVGSAASASPSPTPAPTATAEPSPSTGSTPPLTQTFTSAFHGISLSYPKGWNVRAATEPWTVRPDVAQFEDPGYDVLQDPVLDSNLFLYIGSRPIGDSTPEDWVAATMADCTTTEPITVGGATGLIGPESEGCNAMAAVTSGGRGYWISLYTSPDDPSAVAPYDMAWFEEVLATVRLQPEDAVDAKSSPSP